MASPANVIHLSTTEDFWNVNDFQTRNLWISVPLR